MIHLDVKPVNVLLGGEFEPILADFGSARLTERGTGVVTTAGSPAFRAPEVIAHKAFAKMQHPNPHPVQASADIFSYGALLVCMVLRQSTPYDETLRASDVDRDVLSGVLRPCVDDRHPWCEIVAGCTDKRGSQRPTARELMQKIDAVGRKYDW